MHTNDCMLAGLLSSVLFCVACGPAANTNNPDAVGALNKWWRQTTEAAKPEKAGTVTPAHTITLTNGKTLSLRKHVQTKKEEMDQTLDAQWAAHMRSVVTGFRTDGNTVLVLTTLTTADTKDAQEICRDLGGFVWANDNRHFALENIKVVGASGELLSSRFGLRGNVR